MATSIDSIITTFIAASTVITSSIITIRSVDAATINTNINDGNVCLYLSYSLSNCYY